MTLPIAKPQVELGKPVAIYLMPVGSLFKLKSKECHCTWKLLRRGAGGEAVEHGSLAVIAWRSNDNPPTACSSADPRHGVGYQCSLNHRTIALPCHVKTKEEAPAVEAEPVALGQAWRGEGFLDRAKAQTRREIRRAMRI